MQELAETLANWHKNNTNYAIALVTQTWRSAPRPVGTIMALNEDQKIIGSVSGGCIEGAVAEELMKAINTGESALLHYGIQNETAWQYGLSCGGQIEILIFPINQSQTPTKLWNQAIQYAIDKQPFGLLFQCSNLPNHPLTKELSYQRDTPLFSAKSGYVSLSGKEYFAWIHPPVPNLYIVGGAHLSAELVFLANHFGFQTTVIDHIEIVEFHAVIFAEDKINLVRPGFHRISGHGKAEVLHRLAEPRIVRVINRLGLKRR